MGKMGGKMIFETQGIYPDFWRINKSQLQQTRLEVRVYFSALHSLVRSLLAGLFCSTRRQNIPISLTISPTRQSETQTLTMPEPQLLHYYHCQLPQTLPHCPDR